MGSLEFYASPGPYTDLGSIPASLRPVATDPASLLRIVGQLLVHRDVVDAQGPGLTPDRFDDIQRRSAARVLARVLELDPAPLDVPRSPADRMIGVCSHAAVLFTALLRASGIPARSRCGFAGYFEAGVWLDHWITERWDGSAWIADDPDAGLFDVRRGVGDGSSARFLSGGEAWTWCRGGGADPTTFGVAGHTFGPAEISGNAIRDLAALDKIELLPWDEWGHMKACYDGLTDEAYDSEIDDVADATMSDDLDRIQALLRERDHLRPDPAELRP